MSHRSRYPFIKLTPVSRVSEDNNEEKITLDDFLNISAGQQQEIINKLNFLGLSENIKLDDLLNMISQIKEILRNKNFRF